MRVRIFAAFLAVLFVSCAKWLILTGPKTSPLPTSRPAINWADLSNRESLRFVVLGDAGTGSPDQLKVGAQMFETCETTGGCDFALVVGDNLYAAGAYPDNRPAKRSLLFEKRFEAAYEAFEGMAFWLVAGNHDWYRKGSVDSELAYTEESDRWRMPALDYQVPGLPDWLTIYGVDTTLIDEGVPNGQVARARSALCPAEGWKVLFAHHPILTPGHHGGPDGIIESVQKALEDEVILACEVGVFFAGHEHLQAHLETERWHQIIQGAGGRKLHAVEDGVEFPHGVSLLRAESAFGFAVVDATATELKVAFFRLGQEAAFYTRSITRPVR